MVGGKPSEARSLRIFKSEEQEKSQTAVQKVEVTGLTPSTQGWGVRASTKRQQAWVSPKASKKYASIAERWVL